jgi:hypothetical protein
MVTYRQRALLLVQDLLTVLVVNQMRICRPYESAEREQAIIAYGAAWRTSDYDIKAADVGIVPDMANLLVSFPAPYD